MIKERLLIEYPMLASHLRADRATFDEFASVTNRFELLSADLAPYVRRLDQATAVEAKDLHSNVLAIACRYRIFSLALPKSLGGTGCTMLTLAMGLELLAQRCAGLANLLATHGLALALVGANGNASTLLQLAERIVADEARGEAYLLSTAATEPSAGSDLEDDDQLLRARLQSEAEVVPMGYRLSGSKIYVSNGSLAAAHVVLMPTCRDRPRETLTAFLVPRESPGLTVVREERKLGQRASPAAELNFNNCFVPESGRLSATTVSGRSLDLVLGASRSFVGAFGAGIARGVYDTCVRLATQEQLPPSRSSRHPCEETLIGRLWSNARQARASYIEANLVNAQLGLVSFSENGLLRLMDRFVPQKAVGSAVARKLMNRLPINAAARKQLTQLDDAAIAQASSYGSATKTVTSELALENCRLAFELLGCSATREETGLPKYWRDARLLSIYEGTNEICLVDVSKKRQRLERGTAQ